MCNVSLSVMPALLSFVDQAIALLKKIWVNPTSIIFGKATGGFFSYIEEIVIEWLYRRFFGLWITLLKAVYMLEQVFDIFTGVVGVYKYTGNGYTATSGHTNIIEEETFLDVLFNDNAVQNVYWYCMLAAFALCFIVTIFAVIRSIGDSIEENKRPVTAVMRLAFKASIMFLLVPLACFLAIKLSSVVTYSVIDIAQNDTRVCDALFTMGVGNEFKSGSAKEFYSHGQNFLLPRAVKSVYYKNINYLIVYFSAIFMIIILMGCVFQSAIRAFALIILFIVSPWFVATIPFDDGEKFKKWKNLFAGFALASFGPMLIMRIYLAIVPMIAVGSSSIMLWPEVEYTSLSNSSSFWNWTGDTMGSLAINSYHCIVDFVLKLMLLVGGAFAAWHSQYLMMEVIDPEVADLMKRGHFIMHMAEKGVKSGMSAVGAAATGGAGLAAGAVAGGNDDKEE